MKLILTLSLIHKLCIRDSKGILPEPLAGAAACDITEIQGADSLFECDGVIRRCEEAFARRYGAKESLISCGGSTLCIQAMLALAAGPGEKVLFFRNIHKAALDAMILLDIRPVWLFPCLLYTSRCV